MTLLLACVADDEALGHKRIKHPGSTGDVLCIYKTELKKLAQRSQQGR